MDSHEHYALALVKANLGFGLRAAQLLEESRRRWLATGSQLLDQDIDETAAELAQLHEAADWPSLVDLPARAAWRLLNREVEAWQGAARAAISNQTALLAGGQQALAQWQRESAAAFTTARNAMPVQSGLRELLLGWAQAPAAVHATAGARPERPTASRT